MTDQWVPGPPPPPPPAPGDPLPPANSWNPAAPCTSGSNPSIVDGIVITGVPATISSPWWQIVLNDGSAPPNYLINHLDGHGNVIDTPMSISGVDASVAFNDPVYLSEDPVYPDQAATKAYVDTHPGIAPTNGNTYVQRSGAWTAVALVPEAPIDGAIYGRQAASWTSMSFLPLTGGAIAGNLTVNGVMTVQGSNSFVLDGPAGGQRAILSASGGAFRWQMQLADYTTETGNNAGSNFSLSAIGDTGAILSTPLSINRATGAVTIAAATGTSPGAPTLILNKGIVAPQGALIQGQRNGLVRWQLNLANFNAELGGNLGSNFSIDRFDDAGAAMGVSPLLIARATGLATFGYGVTINGVLALAAAANLSMGGGNPDDVLATNGAGHLSWRPQAGAPGGAVPEAPIDGTTYARRDDEWVHLAHTDITDWATAMPGRNRLINGSFRIDQWNNFASITPTASGATRFLSDRWRVLAMAGTTGYVTSQNIIGHAGAQWRALQFTSSAARPTNATDQLAFGQLIEVTNIADLQWGNVAAAATSLSFMALATVAGDYSGAIRNSTSTRSFPFIFHLEANQWTPVSITIPGETTGGWGTGAAAGIIVAFDLGSGDNLRAPPGQWFAGTAFGAIGADRLVSAAGQFIVTNVQFEAGDASEFDWRPYGQELLECQRYYVTAQLLMLVSEYASAGNQTRYQWYFAPVRMRAAPTLVASHTSLANCTSGGISALFFTPGGPPAVRGNLVSVAAGNLSASMNITSLDAEL